MGQKGGKIMLKSMDTLVALCKNRGFIYPGSEIYGGLANTWDYGPLGNELKNNVQHNSADSDELHCSTSKTNDEISNILDNL